MYDNLSTKLKISDLILKQIPKNINYDLGSRVNTSDLLVKWWFTGRGGGLRLTERGDQAFKLAEIEFYEYEIPISRMTVSYHSFVLQLSKKITCPYYLDVNSNKARTQFIIRLYDSKIAMMVGLYGSLVEYLDSIKIK